MSNVQNASAKSADTHPLLVDCDPICCCKPLVVLDVVYGVLEIAVPLGQVDLEQIPQQVLQVAAEVRGKPDLKDKKRIINMIRLIFGHFRKNSIS